jgi:hypothetical protein
MKKITSKFLPTIFLINIFILISISEIFAQKNEVVLELKKIESDKVKYLHEGKTIRFWYQGNKFSGNIDSIGISSFFVDGTEYNVSEIQKIKIRFRATLITGGIIGGVGLVVDGLGINILSGTEEAGCAGPLVMVVGIMVTAVGAVGTAVGTTVFFAGKKYDLDKKWKLNIVQINY